MPPGISPVIPSEYGTGIGPLPSAVPPIIGALVPNMSLQVPGSELLYRNQPVAVSPLGFAEPFSVAEVNVTAVAAEVVTLGVDPEGAATNERTLPKEGPAVLEAIAQK